jgi:hypothetical protein
MKHLRTRPEYDELMESKEQYAFKMTSKEFCSMLWIHDLMEQDFKAKDIRKLIPQEYLWILQDILRQRLKPTQVFVDWGKVAKSLNFSIIHNLAQDDTEYWKYRRELFPSVIS